MINTFNLTLKPAHWIFFNIHCIAKAQTSLRIIFSPCADSESFVRGGPNLTTIFYIDGREDPNKYHYKQPIIDPPAKRHLNGDPLARR